MNPSTVDPEARQFLLRAIRSLHAGEMDADTYWQLVPNWLCERRPEIKRKKAPWSHFTTDPCIGVIDRWACTALIDPPIKKIHPDELSPRDKATLGRIELFLESGCEYVPEERIGCWKVLLTAPRALFEPSTYTDEFPWPFPSVSAFDSCRRIHDT